MYTNQAMHHRVVTEQLVNNAPVFIPFRQPGTIYWLEFARLTTRHCAPVIDLDIADEPVYGHNFDLPDSPHLIEQGYNVAVNDHLEPDKTDPLTLARSVRYYAKPQLNVQGCDQTRSQMDGSHFRELCYQRGNQNHALHLKSKLQLQPKTWMRAEYVMEQLAYIPWRAVESLKKLEAKVRKRFMAVFPHDLGLQIVEAFKTLSITRWSEARRILHGVVATGKIWTPSGTLQTGIEGKVLKPGLSRNPVANAKYLISLAEGLRPEPGAHGPGYELDEPGKPYPGTKGGWKFEGLTTIEDMYAESMTYGFDVSASYDETDADDMADDDTPDPLAEPPKDDEIDGLQKDNAFSSHPLYGDGKDALPYDFEHKIKTADAKELRALVAGMFTSSKEGGSDPEFEFTPDQRTYLRTIGYASYRYMSADERMYLAMTDPKRLDYIEQIDRCTVTFTDAEIDLAERYIQDVKSVPPGTRINKALVKRNGIKIPKRFWFLSSAQQKHFWACWKARKAELAAESRADKNLPRLLAFIGTANRRDAAAAIFAYRDGKSFDLWGIETVIDGAQTPSKETLTQVWGVYQGRFRKVA